MMASPADTRHTIVSDFIGRLEEQQSKDLHDGQQQDHLSTDEELIASLIQYILTFFYSQADGDMEHRLPGQLFKQLTWCYGQENRDLKSVTMQCIIAVISRHFNDGQLSRGSGSNSGPEVDVFLAEIYNLIVQQGTGICEALKCPDLSEPSMYHDPAEFVQPSSEAMKMTSASPVGVPGRGGVDSLSRFNKWHIFEVLVREVGCVLASSTRACRESVIALGQQLFTRQDNEPAAKTEQDENISISEMRSNHDRSRRLAILHNLTNYAAEHGFTIPTTALHPASPSPALPITLDSSFILAYLDLLFTLSHLGYREAVIPLVTDILTQHSHQPSVLLLATAVRDLVMDSLKDTVAEYLVPPIGCFGDREKRAGICTAASLRAKKWMAVPVTVLKPAEERTENKNNEVAREPEDPDLKYKPEDEVEMEEEEGDDQEGEDAGLIRATS